MWSFVVGTGESGQKLPRLAERYADVAFFGLFDMLIALVLLVFVVSSVVLVLLSGSPGQAD